MRYLLVSVLVAMLVTAVAALGQPPGMGRPGEIGLPLQPRARAVADSNDFAFRLYQHLRGEQGNIIVSPYSITTALGMAYAGAAGETKRQMAKAIGFYGPDGQVHAALADLQRVLVARGQAAPGRGGQPFQFHVANALWAQQGQSLLRAYLRTIDMYYAGGLQQLDFRANPEGARGAINQWVSKQTAGKIADLLPRGVLNGNTRLVLTNAIYFNAAWQNQFQKSNTAPGPFTLLSGEVVKTDMMHHTFTTRYAQGKGYQLVELPYAGMGFAMEVLLPDQGTFPQFEQSLTAARWQSLLSSMHRGQVELAMPKWRFDTQLSLAQTLAAMGMKDAFDATRADFSAMDGKRDLFVQAVIHKAMVRVDEEGTEAAAATGVAMGVTSVAPGHVITINVDRPFLFLIREQQTGAILFMGRVEDPR